MSDGAATTARSCKHSGSAYGESSAVRVRATASYLHPQLKWVSERVEDAEGATIEVDSWCYKGHFYLPKMRDGAQYLVTTGKHTLKSVCESWWNQSTPYPLILEPKFSVHCWTLYPPREVREAVTKAGEAISPQVRQVAKYVAARRVQREGQVIVAVLISNGVCSGLAAGAWNR